MKYLSVCSGIEAATVAWHGLDWEPFAFSEIEPFPSKVLAHHYPNVPNLGDMTKFKEWPDATIDLLVGGTPCQSFSVAGLRKGLADPRGNLMLTYLAIADKYRPQWLVWENVPGVLSSNEGKDFGALLGGLAELGYGFAYRVLDAQHFGVPQRRRRVFVVGYLGDWRPAAAVLFERHSLSGNPAPSRKAREEVAGTISSRTTGGGGLGTDFECAGGLQPVMCMATGQTDADISPALSCNHEAPIAFAQNSRDEVRLMGGDGQIVGALSAEPGMKQTCYVAQRTTCVAAFKAGQGSAAGGIGYSENVTPTLSAADSGSNRAPALMHGMAVRRLTPRECERLQGFPDNYTLIPNQGKSADGPRYKALGNSMAVPVMNWIGERIQAVSDIL